MLLNLSITFKSIGTFGLSSSTRLAVKLVIALLIEDAVIIGLLKGEPRAVLYLATFFYAALKGGNGKGVNKVSLALESAVTLSGRTPVEKYYQYVEIYGKVAIQALTSSLH